MRLRAALKRGALALILAVPSAGLSSPAAAAANTPPPLGQPDAVTYLVPDVDAARVQFTQGSGASFTSFERTLYAKVAGLSGTQRIDLRGAVSETTGGAEIELVQASSPNPDVWTGDGRSHVALSYAVDSVAQYAPVLSKAGLQKVVSADGFALWRGIGGVTVRLDEHLPAGNPAPGSEAPIDLGDLASIALYPCDPPAVLGQLGQALGVSWRDSQTYTLPWTLADGSTAAPSSTSTTSQQGGPYITVAQSHGFPGEDVCAGDHSPSYLVYAAGDVTAVDQQLAAAGMRFIGRVPGLITLYISAGNVPVQVVNTAFLPQ